MTQLHIAENLYRLRTFHNYRQKDISEKLNISRQAYSNYERGTRLPDLETAFKLACLYQISLDRLVFSRDPASRIAEAAPSGYTGVTPVWSTFQMSGPEAKMFMSYKQLSEPVQKEVRDYIRFKTEHK